MAKIKTRSGAECEIDDDDYEWAKNYKWVSRIDVPSGNDYPQTFIDGKYHAIHRMVLKLNRGDSRIADHISGNTLDCRKENLRITDAVGNMRNRKRNKNNSTGKTGVHFRESHGKGGAVTAYAHINNKLVSKTFGCLKRGKDAALAMAIQWRNDMESLLQISVRGNQL